METNALNAAVEAYAARLGRPLEAPRAVLFDMDGVLYDSMPGHARSWKKMCDSVGIDADPDEFYAYEGRTGASTINLLYRRQYGHGADDETCKRLYAIKSENFRQLGPPPLMHGAPAAVAAVKASAAVCVLVTGSGQASILERLDRDYDGAFGLRVTAHDVKHGKPDPEPYLMGMAKASAAPWQAIAVDNAPLGVESASRAGAFTIGVRTGPLPAGALIESGADIEIDSMEECAEILAQLL
ncbi:MAG: HAD hydrolase-like protein [Muribaculaceae bacterium]|nr:HAD hydrolase-like protein [Muribaculaceae bacterium]MDE6196474.1 HAD hydrolase-like protein [Muribaculaceae bacterium]